MESACSIASLSDSSDENIMLNPLELRETEAIPSLRPGAIFNKAAFTDVASALRRGASSVRQKIAFGPLGITVGFCKEVRGGRLLETGWDEAEGTEVGGRAAIAAQIWG